MGGWFIEHPTTTNIIFLLLDAGLSCVGQGDQGASTYTASSR